MFEYLWTKISLYQMRFVWQLSTEQVLGGVLVKVSLTI